MASFQVIKPRLGLHIPTLCGGRDPHTLPYPVRSLPHSVTSKALTHPKLSLVQAGGAPQWGDNRGLLLQDRLNALLRSKKSLNPSPHFMKTCQVHPALPAHPHDSNPEGPTSPSSGLGTSIGIGPCTLPGRDSQGSSHLPLYSQLLLLPIPHSWFPPTSAGIQQ